MVDLLATAEALVDTLPRGERQSLLVRWADRLQRQSETLAQLITRSTGKPIRLSRNEVERGIGTVRGTVTAMERLRPVLMTALVAGLWAKAGAAANRAAAMSRARMGRSPVWRERSSVPRHQCPF